MKLSLRPFLCALALASAACASEPLVLRTDPAAIVPTNALHGTRVAVAEVIDARGDKRLGQHRDGLGRVPHFEYAAAGDPTHTVRRLLALLLLVDGAELVDPKDADVVVAVDLLELDVTTDAPLAGEETFGKVRLAVRFRDRAGHTLAVREVEKPFADDDRQDAGLLGDALREALQLALAAMPRPAAAVAAK